MNYRKPIYLILLIIFIAAIFGSSAFLQDSLSVMTDSLQGFQDQNPLIAAALFIAFASLAVLLGPFTSIPLVPPAVVIWGPGLTMVFLIFGWLLGNTGSYLIGRIYGSYLVSKIVGEAEVNSWIVSIQKKVSFWIMLLFRIATPSETGYVFGMMRYDFGKYFTISLLADLPFAYIAVYASEGFMENGLRAFLNLAWLWVALIVAAVILVRYLNEHEKNEK